MAFKIELDESNPNPRQPYTWIAASNTTRTPFFTIVNTGTSSITVKSITVRAASVNGYCHCVKPDGTRRAATGDGGSFNLSLRILHNSVKTGSSKSLTTYDALISKSVGVVAYDPIKWPGYTGMRGDAEHGDKTTFGIPNGLKLEAGDSAKVYKGTCTPISGKVLSLVFEEGDIDDTELVTVENDNPAIIDIINPHGLLGTLQGGVYKSKGQAYRITDESFDTLVKAKVGMSDYPIPILDVQWDRTDPITNTKGSGKWAGFQLVQDSDVIDFPIVDGLVEWAAAHPGTYIDPTTGMLKASSIINQPLPEYLKIYCAFTYKGYNVTFVDGKGNTLKTYTNVPYGSSVEAPTVVSTNDEVFAGWSVPEEKWKNVTENLTITALWLNVNSGLWIRNSKLSWEHYRPQSKTDEVLGWDYSQSGWPWAPGQDGSTKSDYAQEKFPQIWRYSKTIAAWEYWKTVPYLASEGCEYEKATEDDPGHDHTCTSPKDTDFTIQTSVSARSTECGRYSSDADAPRPFIGYMTEYDYKTKKSIETRWSLEWDTSDGHISKVEKGSLGNRKLNLKTFSRGSGWKDA